MADRTAVPGPCRLVCESISKTFGGTVAVRDVSLSLAAGEVLALVGENGAGKSTLMNVIAGAVRPDSGQVLVDGTRLSHGPQAARGAGIAMVHQELSLFGNLTVAENVLLGAEPVTGPLIGERALRETAAKILDDLGIHLDPDAGVARLSPGQRQLVEIAKAVATQPKVLILDEPTSSLESTQVDVLHALVVRLARRGTGIVFVSHRMNELFRFCTKVAVLRGGELAEEGDLADYSHDRLISAMVGRDVSDLYPARTDAAGRTDPVLALREVSGHGLHDITLDVVPGRVTGIAGLEGHGQSAIAEVLAGVRAPTSGQVLVAGAPTRLNSPAKAIAAGVGYVPSDRRTAGLALALSVAENMALVGGAGIRGRFWFRPRRQAAAVREVAARLALRSSSTGQAVGELSGGNQQKVLFGRWLLRADLRVLVLDDPTRGVDVGAREEIFGLLRELTARGVAVVLVSTDIQELLGMADDIVVIYEGRITGTVPGGDATEERVLALAMGQEVPA
ncbi:sugar ABC transporter ATP-binding protein [Actinophytocola gossypii]|uniref:Sugar ABC transporter ATP-binding protein n=1 Tax=Actinophytocola gossypii TaxID=2812003 RepID=A0ABT2J363_9PSEU|nr:sugar ABC transporter ATP-binding protein [Actinophytocola gossypii]MCT2582297.1 sugar ABC transporter ATP-binding protein [Actinophytocola gossypii]